MSTTTTTTTTPSAIQVIEAEGATEILTEVCYAAAAANGWHEDYPKREDYTSDQVFKRATLAWITNKVYLIANEVIEGTEELRDGRRVDEIYFVHPDGTEYTEQQYDALTGAPLCKPEGLPIELADAIIRIGDLTGLMELPTADAVGFKLEYNATRGKRHGGKAF